MPVSVGAALASADRGRTAESTTNGWHPVVRPVAIAGGIAAVLAVAYLLAPPVGTDLSAQVARADFVRDAGLVPVDPRWYGGTVQYGYSLVAPVVMALVGVRLTGALALILATAVLTALLVRTGALRPTLGGAVAAVCALGNLASGRVTFGLGAAFGLLGLLALTAERRRRRVYAAIGIGLAAATSPVAGLFAGLAGVALFLGTRERERRLDAAVVALSAAAPMAVTALVSDAGGWMNISTEDTMRAAVTGVVVAVVVPRRVVRIAAALSVVGVLTAYAMHTPVGLNATRLATSFALPVLAAYVPPPGGSAATDPPVPPTGRRRYRRRLWYLAGIVGLGAVLAWQPPALVGDLRRAGDPATSARYYAPLLAQLRARGPVGRVEIPPTRDYWESAYVAREVYLARGWLRQTDHARNGLFFDGTLSAETYERWLRDNGVSYVALPEVALSWIGRAEAALIRGGLPYLTPVWRGEGWTLYEVAGRPSIVEGATLVATRPGGLTVEVTRPGEVLVRVRYSGWLRADRGSLARGASGWTVLRADTPGRYTITSAPC